MFNEYPIYNEAGWVKFVPRFNFRTSINFLSLPAEVRNAIYELALVSRRQILLDRDGRGTRKKNFAWGLFLANKTISLEARTIFYGMNCFTVANNFLSGPLNDIGCRDAGFVRHLDIDFQDEDSDSDDYDDFDFDLEDPYLYDDEEDWLRPPKPSKEGMLREIFPNISTVKLSIYRTRHWERWLSQQNPQTILLSLKATDDELRQISSSTVQIIVEVTKEPPCGNHKARSIMKDLGWIIRTMPEPKIPTELELGKMSYGWKFDDGLY